MKNIENVNIRLKKVAGQVFGIIKMTEEKQNCEKIIIQFQAVKAAFDSAFSEYLKINLENCLKKHDSKNMKNILKLISKK